MTERPLTDLTSRPELHRLQPVFLSLSDDSASVVTAKSLESALDKAGLGRSDQRLLQLFERLDAAGAQLTLEQFYEVIAPCSLLVERALRGALVIPDFQLFSRQMESIFQEVSENEEGQQARYIPPLADVDPDHFGVAIVTTDGQLFELGHSQVDFSIQSTCKPFNYCFALEELGEETVHQHIGREPSGQRFNAYVLQEANLPHNPMINAGAIMCAGLIQLERPLHRRFAHIRECWSKLTGGSTPRFNAFMAQEEARTGDRNRALAYMMKNEGSFPRGHDAEDHQIRAALELYFQACSLEMNCKELATAAASLARSGVCPVTEERVLSSSTVRHCLSLMHSCGMYDFSGEFAFTMGIPAKSGVGGAVVLVVPGIMGVCLWSPRLDPIGNSVRGVEFARRLGEHYALHIYGSSDRIKQDPRISVGRQRARRIGSLLWAATTGDIRSMRRMQEERVDLLEGDYDKRTALHLAAAEGKTALVSYLLGTGLDPNCEDRWGGTPLDDALLGQHHEVVQLLQAAGAEAKRGLDSPAHVSAGLEDTPHTDPEVIFELLWAASTGDLTGIRRLVASGVYLNAADYDGRRALHLAAAEGQLEIARYLLAHGHAADCQDRWGNTPLEDAEREGHEALIQLLQEHATAS